MTHRDFVYWLQGFLEVSDTKELTPAQLIMVKKHLNLCLTNVTSGLPDILGRIGSGTSYC